MLYMIVLVTMGVQNLDIVRRMVPIVQHLHSMLILVGLMLQQCKRE